MLLVEYTVLDKLQVINEGTKANKRLKVLGKFQKCDEQNNNGRVYPRKILESQVKAIQEKIGDRSLVGALDHPANDAIHLSQASHVITKLWVEKNGDVMGEAEILSTPNGKIVEALLNDNVKIGISSRGLGSVSEGTTGKVVNEDFKLITFDLVSDPSTKGAFPGICESMRENSQRAQAIVSKHKKDRVLLTMLESKINKALKGKQKKIDKNKNGKIDSEDFELLRGENNDEGSMDEKSFPDLSGDGKITKKDVLMGRGVIKKGKKKTREEYDVTGEASEDKENARLMAIKKNKKKKKKKGAENAESVKEAAVEALKKVCWGDRYDEGSIKNNPKKFLAAKKAAAKKARSPEEHMQDIASDSDDSPRRHGDKYTSNQQEAGNTRKRRGDAVKAGREDSSISFKESISKAVNTYLSELNRSERHEVEQGSKDMDDISSDRKKRKKRKKPSGEETIAKVGEDNKKRRKRVAGFKKKGGPLSTAAEDMTPRRADGTLKTYESAEDRTLPPLTDLNPTRDTQGNDPQQLNLLRNQLPATPAEPAKKAAKKASAKKPAKKRTASRDEYKGDGEVTQGRNFSY